jgi:DNA-binding NarL/FixJ family response regulator
LSASLDGADAKGLELAAELRRDRPEIRIVVLLDASSSAAVVSAFRAGASGIFGRDGSLNALCKCIHSVYKGQVWANSEQIRFVLEALASKPRVGIEEDKLACLTKREREVVMLATEGHTNREIAGSLEISEHTVKNYMFSIFEKLGVSSRVELAFGSEARLKLLRSKDRDPEYAPIAWLEDLAERGIGAAQHLLADLYQQGRGVAQDRVSAYSWYLLAQHCETSQDRESAKKQLAKEMSPEQLAEAEGRVVEWLERHNKLARRA